MSILLEALVSPYLAAKEASHQVERGRSQAEIQRLRAEVDKYRSMAEYYEQLLIHERKKNDLEQP